MGIRSQVADVLFELQLDAEFLAALRQEHQEFRPREAAESVARRSDDLSVVVNVDVVPVGEVAGEALVGWRIGLGECIQSLIGEHHAEPECVVRPVALDDRDLVRRVGLLHQDGKEKPCRPSTNTHDPHAGRLSMFGIS